MTGYFFVLLLFFFLLLIGGKSGANFLDQSRCMIRFQDKLLEQ